MNETDSARRSYDGVSAAAGRPREAGRISMQLQQTGQVECVTIEEAVRRYVGVPYRHNGRDMNGLDCLGLIWRFYRDMGVYVPDSDGKPIDKEWYKEDPERYIRGILRVGKPVTGRLKPLDLVYFQLKGVVRHAGIMVSPYTFIHVRENRPVMVSRLSGLWLRAYAGARRLVDEQD